MSAVSIVILLFSCESIPFKQIKMLMIFVMLGFLTFIESKQSKLKYTWTPNSANFDFMVGISYKGVPVCSGILYRTNHVITAATPLHYYSLPHAVLLIDRPFYAHVIYREWNQDRGIRVRNIYYQTELVAVGKSPLAFGKNGKYTPAHDLASMTLHNLIPTHYDALSVRHPIPVVFNLRVFTIVIKSTGVFTIIGHGYADRLHVQQNVQLEAVDYQADDVLVDCDEWIPRSWGHFVCLLNVDNFVGISPGAALLYNGILFAVGSFSLRRGSESILLFTDGRRYKYVRSFYTLVIIDGKTVPISLEPMW